jgi:ParB-like chromosome segregation protein Spo0J
MSGELEINPRFERLLQKLSKERMEGLEQDILANGIIEPIKCWKNQIIDGHHRYEIAQKHDLGYAVMDMYFDSEDAVIAWMLRWQLNRRNLEPNIQTLIIGQLYQIEKKMKGAQEGNKNADKNEVATVATSFSTAEKIADEQGVSPRTVRNAGKVAEAFEVVPEEVKEEFKQGKVTQKELVHLAKEKEPKDKVIPLKNPHINNIRHHANRISQAVKKVQELLAEYESYLNASNANVKSFAKVAHSMQTREVLNALYIQTRALKTLEVCPLCDGNGCPRCVETGFLDQQNFEYVQSDIKEGKARKREA